MVGDQVRGGSCPQQWLQLLSCSSSWWELACRLTIGCNIHTLVFGPPKQAPHEEAWALGGPAVRLSGTPGNERLGSRHARGHPRSCVAVSDVGSRSDGHRQAVAVPADSRRRLSLWQPLRANQGAARTGVAVLPRRLLLAAPVERSTTCVIMHSSELRVCSMICIVGGSYREQDEQPAWKLSQRSCKGLVYIRLPVLTQSLLRGEQPWHATACCHHESSRPANANGRAHNRDSGRASWSGRSGILFAISARALLIAE